MNDILAFLGHPVVDILIVIGTFGLALDVVLRLFLRMYPKDSNRRRELLGELCAVPRWELPFWVAEQFALVVREGLDERRRGSPAADGAEPPHAAEIVPDDETQHDILRFSVRSGPSDELAPVQMVLINKVLAGGPVQLIGRGSRRDMPIVGLTVSG